jgi:hypothetical protein
MPSTRVAIDAARHVVTIRGRGWGHGVGMSQWGALGMARQGAGYRDILRHYYRGTTIGEVSSPGPLEVGIAWARPSVAVLGAYRIVDGSGRVVVPRAFGTWSFDWSASGSVDVRSPEGYGTTPQVKLRAAPRRIPAGRVARLTIQLAAPARVAALASGPGAAAPIIAIKDAGVRSLRWKAPARPGRYRLRVRASNEMGRTSSGVRRVAVIADPRGPEGSGASPNGPWDTIALGLAAAVLLALVAVGSASFAATIRK